MNLTCFSLLLVIFWSVHLDAKPNILLICVDDLRPELNSFGADHILSPNIDRLASQGRPFLQHYVQAPTCGASRYTLLTGQYGPAGNNALFERVKNLKFPSLPAYFNQNGYQTISVGKVSHHPGGKGGEDWDDESSLEMPNSWDRHILPSGDWLHPRGAMHGLANGEIRKSAKDMDVFQSENGGDEIYPDGLIINEALSQLDQMPKEKPFFLAVGIIRPHLPFGAPAQYMNAYRDKPFPKIINPTKPDGKTTWHGSGEFMKYNRWNKDPNRDPAFALEVRKHYAACVTYADALVGRLLAKLDQLKLRKNTIVILWGDHGWHLGEHAIWGKHSLFEESLRSPLIISYPKIPKPGKFANGIVETLDIFPTLCDLAKLPIPNFTHGQSLYSILKDPNADGHSAVSYGKNARTIRTSRYRLISHPKKYFELYDHSTAEKESKNIASKNSKIVLQLLNELEFKINRN